MMPLTVDALVRAIKRLSPTQREVFYQRTAHLKIGTPDSEANPVVIAALASARAGGAS